MTVRSLALLVPFLPVALLAQTTSSACTGLCLQQVQCPNGGTTTISGTVYAPNGVDPIPNVTVYVPNAAVPAMASGISCPVPGAAPAGSPLIGTYSAFDGTFTLTNAPVGTGIPVVIVAGKWRRQATVTATAACADTHFDIRFPRNQSEGDIPKFAVATGNADQVECVLRKVGIDDTEFTNGGGTGRIQLYQGTRVRGARIDTNTASANALMGDSSNLNSYDVLMLPCEGSQATEPAAQLSNLVSYANGGGRVYGSHFAYSWMYTNPPFDSVANWVTGTNSLVDGPATVNQGFGSGVTLARWLQLVKASTTLGQISVSQPKHNVTGVNAPTQTWLTLNDSSNSIMQFTWDTPVGATGAQCGRVLFNEYHVESNSGGSTDKIFPAECSTADMTPQEKLLEYSLFDLSNDGGPATMTPASADFGNQALGFLSASQNFTVTNNSVFVGDLAAAPTTTGDFVVTGNTCHSVPSQSSCTVSVAFNPTALGARTGTLSVVFAGTTLTSTLTGNGVPPFALNLSSLDFGNVDVGASLTKSFTLTNQAPGPLGMPPLTLTGDYTAATNCPTSIAAGASCQVNVTFKPSTTGARPGTVSTPNNAPITLTGNGVDFALKMDPSSGNVVAGIDSIPTLTATPLAGFSAPVTLTCSTDAPATTCTVASTGFTLSAATSTPVTISTTAQYKLAGYGTDSLLFGFAVLGSGLLVCSIRRRSTHAAGITLALIALTVATTTLTGCSGKIPDRNATFTPSGSYTVTVSATDGTITRTATFAMQVKSN